MVLDHYVCQKAFEGDIDAVKAWLVADPSRDVTDTCACGGSWTSYCRRPHKEVLRLRSLFARGRATLARAPRRTLRCYGAARHGHAVEFLVKLGDNGVVWKILEFWQATR